MKRIIFSLLIQAFVAGFINAQVPAHSKWQLVWHDEFNTEDSLDINWEFQNKASGHILSSRWRANASVKDGKLVMLNKKEKKEGQEFTTASLWTKQTFKYGYFECRYRYGASTGLNNSFWLMNRPPGTDTTTGIFEIDINEGHYPNEIATNTHRHRPLPHLSDSRVFRIGETPVPAIYIELEKPVKTDKIRFIANDYSRSRVAELRIYVFNKHGYPLLKPDGTTTREADNIALKAKARANSVYRNDFPAAKAIDSNLDTRWTSADSASGELILTLDKKYEIGALHLVTGWKNGDAWQNPVYSYTIQAWTGKKWVDIHKASAANKVDLTSEFHVYGLEWNERELIWYFDGKELRREPNVYCHGETPVWLSSAVIRLGPVTDKIHNTSMDVEYVRIYKLVQ